MQDLSILMEPGEFAIKVEGVDKLDAKVAASLINFCAVALDCLPEEIAPDKPIQLFLTESHEGCFELIFQYAAMSLDSFGDVVNQLYEYRESFEAINLFLDNLLTTVLIYVTVKGTSSVDETPMGKLAREVLQENSLLQKAAKRLIDALESTKQHISDIAFQSQVDSFIENEDSEGNHPEMALPVRGFQDLLYIVKKKLTGGWIGRIKGFEVQVNFTRTARAFSEFSSLAPGTYIECDYIVNRRRTRNRISIDVTNIYSEFAKINRPVRAGSRAAMRRMRSRDE